MVDSSKLLQNATVSLNVNHEFYRDFLWQLNEEIMNGLIAIGTSGLHVLHNSFKEDLEVKDWNLVPFCEAFAKLFNRV